MDFMNGKIKPIYFRYLQGVRNQKSLSVPVSHTASLLLHKATMSMYGYLGKG